MVSVSAGIHGNARTTFCVIVVVEDVNDHKPNFTKPLYVNKVVDSTPVGTRIMAVYATDADAGSLGCFFEFVLTKSRIPY